ncbi:MAG TPA: phage tail protein [Candidatus Rokubacteria bacterium]|nr:phage tail protein [Candidatus Rokubacteria bacterium]
MGVIGTPRKFHKKYAFTVEIDGIESAAFTKCSEIKASTAVIEQHEGGSPIPAEKAPGRTTFEPITLERGSTRDHDLFDWFKQVIDAPALAGTNEPGFRRNLDVVQKDRNGAELRRWRVKGAWPSEFIGGAWDNTSDENVVESVTLQIDYFDLVQA